MGVVGNICSSLNCELKIVHARNVELKSPANLFVRFYLSAGSNRKIELNTEEIRSRSDFLFWNQSISLECQGDEASIEELKHQSIVFELRRRKYFVVFRKVIEIIRVGGSWRDFLEKENPIFKYPGMNWRDGRRWVRRKIRFWNMVSLLLLKIDLKVQASQMVKTKQRSEDLCGCRDYETCNCADYEALVLGLSVRGNMVCTMKRVYPGIQGF